MTCFTAYIERDMESGMYIGNVPAITGAHTIAATLDELHVKLKEVLLLCLEEMGEDEIKNLPVFAGVSQIEITI